MLPSSRGQDNGFSSRQQGFESPWECIKQKSRIYPALLFLLFNQTSFPYFPLPEREDKHFVFSFNTLCSNKTFFETVFLKQETLDTNVLFRFPFGRENDILKLPLFD
jgi:hypothetical protein